jgi:putative sterol carrier protein
MASAPPFLEALVSRGKEPLLRDVNGTIRFDLRQGTATDHWTVAIADEAVSLTHRKLTADCVATMSEDVFRSITSGETNAFAAALRGDIGLSGDPALLLAFQRIFPGPPVVDARRSDAQGAPR